MYDTDPPAAGCFIDYYYKFIQKRTESHKEYSRILNI